MKLDMYEDKMYKNNLDAEIRKILKIESKICS